MKGSDWKKVNWLYVAGALTVVYLIVIGWLIGPSRVANFVLSPETQLNAFGDFLAGTFAPLALIWLVAAVLTQRQELDEAREQFADSQAVIKAQLDGVQRQNENAEQTAIRNYKLSLFEYRFEIFKSYEAAIYGVEAARVWQDFSDAAAKMSNLAKRAQFLFGSEISGTLSEVSALLETYAAKQREIQTGKKPPIDFGLGVISENIKLDDLLNTIRLRENMFEKYLKVTEGEKD